MPIYEFSCNSCGHRFEKLCQMSVDDAGVVCPECSGKGAKRELSEFFAVAGKASKPSGCPLPGGAGSCSHSGGCPHAH